MPSEKARQAYTLGMMRIQNFFDHVPSLLPPDTQRTSVSSQDLDQWYRQNSLWFVINILKLPENPYCCPSFDRPDQLGYRNL